MSGQYQFVNKQFNSPINLYSAQNVQETLDRQTQLLSNGAVGIDFQQMAKPTNLRNSAVLRLLEEEEQRQKGVKQVVWPPPANGEAFVTEESPIFNQGGIQQPQGQQQHQRPSPTQFGYTSPHSQTSISPTYQQQQQQQQQPQSPQPARSSPASQQGGRTWAHVASPVSVKPQPQFPQNQNQQYQSQPHLQQPQQFQNQQSQYQQQQYQQPQYQPQYQPQSQQQYQKPQYQQPQQQQPQQQQQQDRYQPKVTEAFRPNPEPPATTITLRQAPPISQEPPPVFPSQPATAQFKGGVNMRGDLKWPPEPYKKRAEIENELRIQLAKGPAFRPRRVEKDYTPFFAQHALNQSYPKYRVPPGTQYYEHVSQTSHIQQYI